ncbi:MAG TPA: isoprenylcysteine carboxylmethyltransferase family protein [Caulobacteraceae bacterium]
MSLSLVILLLVSLQRLGELLLARRNTLRLLAAGAREEGAGHYPLIVLLHGAWLAGLWFLAWKHKVSLPWLGVFVVLQVLRVWIIATLGERWTTRIIVPRAAQRIRKGPYRFLAHPNYVVVAAEIAVLPLVFGLALYAAVFSVLNAAILWFRIRAESRALGLHSETGGTG